MCIYFTPLNQSRQELNGVKSSWPDLGEKHKGSEARRGWSRPSIDHPVLSQGKQGVTQAERIHETQLKSLRKGVVRFINFGGMDRITKVKRGKRQRHIG